MTERSVLKLVIMKRIFWMCLFIFLPCALCGQSVAGRWEGVLDAGRQRLRIVFHIVAEGEGYTATFDSPDQGALGLPVAAVDCRNGVLTLDLGGATYNGALLGDKTLSGTFTQGGMTFPLTLARTGDVVPLRRPQEPQPPYPYTEQEVDIPNADAGIVLHGTLTLPEGPGPHPAVILFTGSGLQNRDEEIMGHRPFRVLADYLTRRGIAVLRCDDRGYGASEEELRKIAGSTTLDFAGDMRSMFRYMRQHRAVDSTKIGLLGHSEGACVAFMTAAREPEAAFVVSMAGMFVKGADLLVAQNRALLRQMGVGAADTEAYCRVLSHVFAAVERLTPVQVASSAPMIADTLLQGEARNLPQPLRDNLPQVVKQLAAPWMHFFLTYDPASDIAALGHRPFLALNGDRDVQVDAAINLSALHAMTAGRAYPRSMTCSYEGLNHLFQHCETGGVDEYARIEETISPKVLNDIAVWIVDVTGLAHTE